jgi:hypothetical protein
MFSHKTTAAKSLLRPTWKNMLGLGQTFRDKFLSLLSDRKIPLGHGVKSRNSWIAGTTKHLVTWSSLCWTLSAKSLSVKGALSPLSAGRKLSRLFVPPRVVGTGKLTGREPVEASLDSLAWPKFMFCAELGDRWDGGLAVSVISDGVRHNPMHNTLLTPVLGCHWQHSYLNNRRIGICISLGHIFDCGSPREHS